MISKEIEFVSSHFTEICENQEEEMKKFLANSIESHIKNIREGIEKMNGLKTGYKLIERTMPDPTYKINIKSNLKYTIFDPCFQPDKNICSII